ncbi:MAG: hypothetical protein M3092_03205, partial [Actinomycetia bacterium]|nr:hypothetical protein [Actinomycetes bacterium]
MGSQTTDGVRKSAGSFFISADGARARRPMDVAVGVLGVLMVLVTALKSDQIEWATDAVGQLIALFPSWMLTAFTVVYGIGLIYALVIIVMTVVHFRTRRDLARDIAIVIGLSVLSVIVLTRLVSGAWPVLLPELSDGVRPLYPVTRV